MSTFDDIARLKINSMLNDFKQHANIVDFVDKASYGSYLRGAVLSHLCYLFRVTREEAVKYLDEWIKEMNK
jgi:hypothetical protein